MHAQAHPDVPVVENMEDLWKVSKLQRERKRRQEQIAALKEARAAKAGILDPQLKIESINIDVVSSLSRTSIQASVRCALLCTHGRKLNQDS